MKVLTCIICSTRTWELTWDTFERHLLKPFNSDLCLSIGVDSTYNSDNPFYKNAKYKFLYPEPHCIGSAIDAACALSEKKPNWRQLLRLPNIWLGGVKDDRYEQQSGSALPLFYRWWLVHNLKLHNLIDEYDWFVVTRSDNYFEFDHANIANFDPAKIYVPEGEDYNGVCDRHFVVSKQWFESAINVMQPFIDDPDTLYDELFPIKPLNIERYQTHVFRKRKLLDKIERFERCMYLVKGPKDSSRWSHGVFEPRCNKTIKYHSEFEIVWAHKLKKNKQIVPPQPFQQIQQQPNFQAVPQFTVPVFTKYTDIRSTK